MRKISLFILSLVLLSATLIEYSLIEIEEEINSRVSQQFQLDINGDGSISLDSEEDETGEGETNLTHRLVFVDASSQELYHPHFISLVPAGIYLKKALLGVCQEIFTPPEA